MAEKRILQLPLSKETDTTCYLTPNEANQQWLLSSEHQVETQCELLEFPVTGPQSNLKRGNTLHRRGGDGFARAVAVSSFQGRLVSVTLRKQQYQKEPTGLRELSKEEDAPSRTATFSEWDKPLNRGKFLLEAQRLADMLTKALLGDGWAESGARPVQGLLIVAGQTESGKTELLRRFLAGYLRMAAFHRLPPHLLTYEDPIEIPLWTLDQMMEWRERMQPLPIDYTPREKMVDALSLSQVLSAALRQTPAAVFVGETRELDDWRKLLDFAATGHLVVTTSHAGSLIECMDSLLRACKADSPAGRAEVASRVLGIIHLRGWSIPGGRKDSDGNPVAVKAQLPSVWRTTDLGQKLLMAEGLSSIVPGFGNEETSSAFSFGRSHFASKIREGAPDALESEEKWAYLLKQCRDWDLTGA